MDISTELDFNRPGGLSIGVAGKAIPINDTQAYLQELVVIWENNGRNSAALSLLGLTILQQVNEMQQELKEGDIDFPTMDEFIKDGGN